MLEREFVLTPAELCSKLKIAKTTAAIMRMRGDGPTYVRIGRKVVYRVSDVEAWLSGLPPHSSTSEYSTGGVGRPKVVTSATGGGK